MKNYKILAFNQDTGNVKFEDIVSTDSEVIETKQGVYPIENTKQYFDATNGGMYYVVNVDLPSKIESENLKNLRRSTVVKNLFNYNVKKSIDPISLMPWLIIALLIIF